MSPGSPNPTNPDPLYPDPVKLLPDAQHATAALPGVVQPALPVTPPVAASVSPVKQLADRPQEELEILAEDLGLRLQRFKNRQDLISAIHVRRQLIAGMNREAMADVLRWVNHPPSPGASKEALAHEIVTLRTMRFDGLTQRGLVVLGSLRGLELKGDEPIPMLIRRLKKQESFFAKMNRKRRTMLGAVVSNFLGPAAEAAPTRPGAAPTEKAGTEGRSLSIQHEIEEAGLFGGLAGRIKKSADGYVNQKLDEIEARIDRKLDEIDRRLAEWRDKEIANRILILKITLWASVIVGLFSLVYSYIQIHFPR